MTRIGHILAASAALATGGCEKPPAKPLPSPHYASGRCGGAPAGWDRPGIEEGQAVLYNRLDLAPSGMLWNGHPIGQSVLASNLSAVASEPVQPATAIVIAPDMDCAAVARLRAMLNARLRCSASRACVEYSEAEWAEWHQPVPPCDANCQVEYRARETD